MYKLNKYMNDDTAQQHYKDQLHLLYLKNNPGIEFWDSQYI